MGVLNLPKIREIDVAQNGIYFKFNASTPISPTLRQFAATGSYFGTPLPNTFPFLIMTAFTAAKGDIKCPLPAGFVTAITQGSLARWYATDPKKRRKKKPNNKTAKKSSSCKAFLLVRYLRLRFCATLDVHFFRSNIGNSPIWSSLMAKFAGVRILFSN